MSRECTEQRKETRSYFVPGHYRALEWDETQNAYGVNENLGIQVDVEVRGYLLSLETLTIIFG